ncbi:MAG: hypothetical protein K2X87_06935 [Gemmataceae bacterium]|nr:hypothetical protein [Gemmataceae bacterium]
MQTLHATETTGPDGTLSLRLPVGQPGTTFDVVVVVHPKPAANGATPPANPSAAAKAIFAELAATGRTFGDSAVEQREGRDERADPWAATRAIFARLAASGRVFSDSVPDIREDRDR